MCGNFGLLLLVLKNKIDKRKEKEKNVSLRSDVVSDHKTVTERKQSSRLIKLLDIIRRQTSSTEFRGGQAGGLSCIEFGNDVLNTRVRCVARKRYPLAMDLVDLFYDNAKKVPGYDATVTIIGHTRFATSSVNIVSELHPHEWVPFHDEMV